MKVFSCVLNGIFFFLDISAIVLMLIEMRQDIKHTPVRNI
jgi:hypothetical protein